MRLYTDVSDDYLLMGMLKGPDSGTLDAAVFKWVFNARARHFLGLKSGTGAWVRSSPRLDKPNGQPITIPTIREVMERFARQPEEAPDWFGHWAARMTTGFSTMFQDQRFEKHKSELSLLNALLCRVRDMYTVGINHVLDELIRRGTDPVT